MKRNILWILGMLCTLIAIAQQKPGRALQRQQDCPYGCAGNRVEMPQKMREALNLTDTQRMQMKALGENFRQQMKALNENEQITVKQQRDERFDLQRNHRAEMKKILTGEQLEKARALRAEAQKKMESARSKGFEQMAEQLKLTERQKMDFADMQAAHRKSMQAIRDNEALDRTQRDLQVKALMVAHRNEVSSILTKEQQAQLEALRKERPLHRCQGAGLGPNGHGHGHGHGMSTII